MAVDDKAKEEDKKKKESELEKKAKEEAEKLEQKKKAEEEKKIKEPEKKEKGFLEKIVDVAYHAAIGVGATALGLATAGVAAPIISGAFGGGFLIGNLITKKKHNKPLYEIVNESLRIYSVVNAILHPMILLGDVTFPLINNATLLGKAARAAYAIGPYNMAFLTLFKTGDHLVKNKFDLEGIGKSVKDNWVPMYKRFAWGFAPALALASNGITSIAGYPTFAYNALPLGIYNGINPPGPKKKAPQPAYPQPGYQPV